MQDSVWVMYKDNEPIGVAATKADAVRYLVDVEWIKLDRKEIGCWGKKKYIYFAPQEFTPREAAALANTTIEKILEKALENQSPYFMWRQLRIQEQPLISGYNTPVE